MLAKNGQPKNTKKRSKQMMALTIILASSLTTSLNVLEPKADALAPSSLSGGTGATKPLQDIKIIEMIDYHLRALREGDIARAYEATSKEFRKATPLEGFQKFLGSFPILTNHKQIDVKIEAIQVSRADQASRADVVVTLNPEKEAIPVEYQLVKEAGLWKIWNIQVISRTAPAIANLLSNPELLKQPIEAQLNALKNDEVIKAYEIYTSNQFKKIVSLDIFKQFLTDFPALTDFKSIKFLNPSIHNGTGLISVELLNEKGSIIFGYTLGIEDEKWKIWGMEVTSESVSEDENQPAQSNQVKSDSQVEQASPEEKNVESDAISVQAAQIEKDLIQIITLQLKTIQEGNLEAAYRNFTSKEFQAATSLEQFDEFVRNHPPLLENKSSEFGKVFFDNSIGNVNGTLTASDGSLNNVEYSLVNQNGSWKILQMKVFPAKARPAGIKSGLTDVKSSSFSFSKIVFGSSMSPAGYVIDPTTVIKSDTNKLYINLYVQGGVAGTVVKIQINDIDTNSSLPPISTTLQQDGDAVVSFVFNPPLEGWPPGNYQAHVTSSTGVSNEYNFTVQ